QLSNRYKQLFADQPPGYASASTSTGCTHQGSSFMYRNCFRLSLLLGTALAGGSPLWAAPPVAGLEFFEKEIRPILVEHCVKCHGGEKVRGGLKLTSGPNLRQGGDSGPVVMPGKPDESLLVKAIRYNDPDLKMPPTGKLPPARIAALETWVRLGAPTP